MTVATSASNIVMSIAGGGVSLAIVNQMFTRRKNKADAESVESDIAARLLRSVSDELERLQLRQIVLEKRFGESEDARIEAEGRAQTYATAEQDTRHQLATLQRAYVATRERVDYLTGVVIGAGLAVEAWLPSPGIPLRIKENK